MRTTTLILVAVLASTLLAATPAIASHEEDCTPTKRKPDLRVEDHAIFQVHTRLILHRPPIQPMPQPSTAAIAYQETNGVPGIQRDDPFERDIDCGHGPDTLVAGVGCAYDVTVQTGRGISIDPDARGCVAGSALAPPGS